MGTLLLPLRCTCPAIASHALCRKGNGSTQARSGAVLLSSSYARVRTNLSASFKVAERRQLTSGMGRGILAARATLATEEGGVNEAKLVAEEEALNDANPVAEEEAMNETTLGAEEEGMNEAIAVAEEDGMIVANAAAEEEGEIEAKVAAEEGGVNEAEVATEEVEDAAPTNSGSDSAVAQSVELLKTASKTKKVPASEIVAAFKVLEKAKVDPSDFLSLVGGTKSPGRTWMLIFTSNKDGYNVGRGTYFPVTAVQNFDSETKFIENGIFLGPLGELTFCGNFTWEKRKLAFIFHTLTFKIGPFGPFRIPVGSKDQEITKTSPCFIWSYADDELLVGKGKAGGTAFWVRCERVKKPL